MIIIINIYIEKIFKNIKIILKIIIIIIYNIFSCLWSDYEEVPVVEAIFNPDTGIQQYLTLL